MKKMIISLSIACLLLNSCTEKKKEISMNTNEATVSRISLAGQWSCKLDPKNIGSDEKWYMQELETVVKLPGSLNMNGLGDKPNKNTKWTSSPGSGVFDQPKYEPYHSDENFKHPFWLTPNKRYVGPAWYQKQIDIPQGWSGKNIKLNLERCHWETNVWVDDKYIGTENSLCVNQIYDLGKLPPGKHRLTICVDNTVKIELGNSAHSISDQTQTNWNGIIGDIELFAIDDIEVSNVQVLPDIENNIAKLKIEISNPTGVSGDGALTVKANAFNTDKPHLVRAIIEPVVIDKEVVTARINYQMGDDVQLWSEFSPTLYELTIDFKLGKISHSKTVTFGMREVGVEGKQVTINNRRIFFRGTLDCCIYPLTGYPPMDVAGWERTIKIAQAHGLNHMRFHSWCPPKAAFEAADKLGFYFQVEGPVWGYVGENEKTDKFLYAEYDRILKEYANHPSFVLFSHGNEPWGDNHKKFLADLVNYLKGKESRVLFTSGSGWPALDENQFHCLPEPRAQLWGAGLSGRFNLYAPATNVDYKKNVAKYPVPLISHEIGQWCVYPNFDEIKKYTGVLKPKNYEIFRDFLDNSKMLDQANDFFMASGKFQTLLYKEEIEAALRTPDFMGFQLLDLHDFPGQGTALVGILDAFWDSKPYVTPQEFNRFCAETVPLAAMEKLVWENNETFVADIMVAHFAPAVMTDTVFEWNIKTQSGELLDSGSVTADMVPIASGTLVGKIKTDLSEIKKASKLNLTISIKNTKYENDWDIWVYPAQLKVDVSEDILIATELDDEAQSHLADGKKVLLMPGSKNAKGDEHGLAPTGFSSIFWNTAYTGQQQPHTMGVLCDVKHKALADFPTDFHSNWQWWYVNEKSRAMIMNDLPAELRPIVQVVDDWFKARKLGLVFEAKVKGGKLLVTSIDLLKDIESDPVVRQMYYSLVNYMDSSDFAPKYELSVEQVNSLFNPKVTLEVVYTDDQHSDYPSSNAVDGDEATIWHTNWSPSEPMPHEIQIKMSEKKSIRGITYLPRQENSNGRIKDYEVYVSIDGKEWGEPAAKGSFSTRESFADMKLVWFENPVDTQYIRFVALSEIKGNQFASVAEIGVIFD